MSELQDKYEEIKTFIVTVEIDVLEGHAAEFRSAITLNATLSSESEPGCLQFHVAVKPDNPCRFFLYEIYRQKADFDAHLAAGHFQEFDKLTAPWVIKKVVQTYGLVYP